MAIRNDSQFLLIPSAYKVNTLYSQRPSSGSCDITATRNSFKTRFSKGQINQVISSNYPALSYINMEESRRGKLLSCPAFNIEERKTNHLLFSEDITQQTWNYQGGVVEDEYDIFINGFRKAQRFVSNSAFAIVETQVSNQNEEAFNDYRTFSGFIKPNKSGNFFLVNIRTPNGFCDVLFDMVRNEVITFKTDGFKIYDTYIYPVDLESTQSVFDEDPNPWRRFVIVIEDNFNHGEDIRIGMRPKRKDDLDFNDIPGSDCLLGAFQWEAEIHETSYIGTTSQKSTRFPDLAADQSGNFQIVDQSTIYADIRPNRLQKNKDSYISFSNGNGSERLDFWVNWKSRLYIRIVNGGQVALSIKHHIKFKYDRMKICIALMHNNIIVYINGEKIAQEFVVTPPLGTNKLTFQDHTEDNEFSIFKGDVHEMFLLPYMVTETQQKRLTEYNPT